MTIIGPEDPLVGKDPDDPDDIGIVDYLNAQGYNNILPFGFASADPTQRYATSCDGCESKLKKAFDTYARICSHRGGEAAAEYLRIADLDCECETGWMKDLLSPHQPLEKRFPGFLENQERKYLTE